MADSLATEMPIYREGVKLANEIHGLLYAYEDTLRDVVGHTNFNIYAMRLKAFEEALAETRSA